MHRPSRALLFLPVVAAVAGGPFAGDDSGFVPPSRSVAKCEEQVARSLASFDRCVVTCNMRAVKAAFKGRSIHLPACTQTGARSCRGKYDRASARTARTGRCPACLSPPAEGLLADRAAARLERTAAAIQCRAAPDAAALRCEAAVARNLTRTIVCIANCHVAAANAGLSGRPFDEEGCERSCRRSYDDASARLAPRCPPCLGGAEQADLADQVEAAADEENGDIFCAGGSTTTTTTSTTLAVSTTSTTVGASTTSIAPPTSTTSTTLATSTTSIAPTTSTTSTTLACTGEGAPCGVTLDGCTARMVCVDGALVCRGTFVAPSPRGDPANSGTESAPVSSIAAGIDNAALLGVGAVCACAGSYFEDLTIVEGISLRGGYDCTTWARDPTTNFTGVTGLPPDGVKVPPGVTAATSLDGLLVAGIAGLADVSSALTVTDASPTLENLTVTNRGIGTSQTPPTLYALRIRQTGVSPASPTIDGGEYRAVSPAGGTGIGIFIEGASPSLTHVVAYGAGADMYSPTPATAVGIRCVGCAGTTISQSGIVGGPATAMSVGLWASGDVSGLSADKAFFWGGSAGVSAVLSYGTLLDDCTGTSTWSVVSSGYFFRSPAPTTGIGFAASGASCAPSLTASRLVGCDEYSTNCTALECRGAPCTVTDSVLDATFDVTASAATSHGASCLDGGCVLLARNTITTGIVYGGHLSAGEGIGVDVQGASPTLDANVIEGPSCPSGASSSMGLSTLRLRDSASVVTNNLLRGGSCSPAASEVVRFEKGSGPEVLSPTIENNTLEYGAAHTGLFISSTGSVPPAGYVRNNIIQNTGPGGPSFAVYEADASSDLSAFENNDLDDPSGALYYDEGTTALTLSQVNALPGAAANISADPLLDATGHLAAESPCRNAGTATGAPATDLDGQPRPQEGAFDIGADEFVP